MNTSELSDLIDELEIRRAEARSAVEMARRAVYVTGAPETNSVAAWLVYQAEVTKALEAVNKLDAIEQHLTVAAEMEQAIKEGRWDDVATWAARLSVFENETIQAVTPEASDLTQEMTFAGGATASRAATDLRNRGFQVANDLTGRTILVRTPAGWTGTAAADVAGAHGVERITTSAKSVGDIVLGPPAKALSKCPGVPHRSLANERTCVVSGGIIGASGQCEVHEGAC